MAYTTVPFHGKTARIVKNGTAVAYSTGYSINVVLDMSDASYQGTNWKYSLPGQAGWSGSMDMWFVPGNTEQAALMDNILTATPGTKLTDVRFSHDTSINAWYGDLYITGFTSAPSNNGGTVGASFNFQGDGALAVEATS